MPKLPKYKLIERFCKQCGDKLTIHNGREFERKNFCSNACHGNWRLENKVLKNNVKLICEICGKEFYRHKSQAEKSKYCSLECRKASGNYRELKNKKVSKICEACGKEYLVQFYRKDKTKFCSKNCSNHLQYEKRIINCKTCNNEFTLSKSRFDKNIRYCSTECRMNDPEVKTEKERRRQSILYKRAQNGYYKSRNFKKYLLNHYIPFCQICGFSEYKECIDIHHVDFDCNNNIEENVIFVCVMCHRKIHSNIISVNKNKLIKKEYVMPEPKSGEKRSEYIPRCISYVIENEGLDSEQAAGKCFGMWKQHLKNKRSKGEELTKEELEELQNIDKTELEEVVNKL